MFTIDPKIDEKDLKRKTIYKVLLSMNSHQVATPETSLEEARSYVFVFREGKNSLSVYIGLHLLLTDRKLIYKHSANPFSEDKLAEVEEEARDFAEYMGAMLDEVDFSGMSDLEQDKWIEEQGIFSAKKQQEVVPMGPSPLPEAAASPVPQPPATPEQPASATEAISAPESPATVQSLPKASPAEAKEKKREAPEMETVQKDVQDQARPPAGAKRREIARKESETNIETPLKPKTKKTSYSVSRVVSRDREALARLLTSF